MNDQSIEKQSPRELKRENQQTPITLRDAALQRPRREKQGAHLDSPHDSQGKVTATTEFEGNFSCAGPKGLEIVQPMNLHHLQQKAFENSSFPLAPASERSIAVRESQKIVELNSEKQAAISHKSASPKSLSLEPQNREIIPGFRLIDHLGTGRLFNVFMALDENDSEQPVAIRIFRQEITHHLQLAKILEAQLRQLLGLKHPHLLTIKRTGYLGGELYIVSEYVDGLDLASLLKLRNTIPAKMIATIFFDVLRGLSHLHRFGAKMQPQLAHGYLSPSAILIGVDGVTRVNGVEWGPLRDTRGGELTNPLYKAPEHITGGLIVPQTDLFQVASLIYEAACGEPAFEAESLENTLARILVDQCHQSPAVESLPIQQILDLISPALEKKIEKRYQSAEVMSHQLLSNALNTGQYASASEVGTFVQNTLDKQKALPNSALDPTRLTKAAAKSKPETSAAEARVPLQARYSSSQSLSQTAQGKQPRIPDRSCAAEPLQPLKYECSKTDSKLKKIKPPEQKEVAPLSRPALSSLDQAPTTVPQQAPPTRAAKSTNYQSTSEQLQETSTAPHQQSRVKKVLQWLAAIPSQCRKQKEIVFKVAFMILLAVFLIKFVFLA